ncbi:TetR/AcrR family transcriptional regulator [Agromyces endophyticus]|uniref:TetR/AcrR family transcriptional regulator n=1 Tax=Agromyces sp. H17E-10 TaxID=2932244 RepID=UPI001FD2BAD5|nr:TetR/AcrR family transcriptional regulator [Agromyces sp. H17E-10]UOQ88370.1 TetR/AcrR family transcriptional regulator [Agromyces sp. H17E-10]
MARPPVHDEALRGRLLDVTAEVVARDGAAKAALRDIARSAGTSTSAIYTLFGGKGELLAAVIEHGFESFAAAQHDAAPGGLRALGVAYREWAIAHPALYRLMFDGSLDDFADCEPDPAAASDSLVPLQAAIAATGSPDVARDAVAVWAQVHGAVSLEFAGVAPPDADWDAVYATVLDTIERRWGVATR